MQLRRNCGNNEGRGLSRIKGYSENNAGPMVRDNRTWGDGDNKSEGVSTGISEQLDYILQPSHFATLKAGGSQNRRICRSP